VFAFGKNQMIDRQVFCAWVYKLTAGAVDIDGTCRIRLWQYLLLNLIPIFHSWLMRPHGLSSRVTSNTVFVVQDLHF
jgi:hypothetical protein